MTTLEIAASATTEELLDDGNDVPEINLLDTDQPEHAYSAKVHRANNYSPDGDDGRAVSCGVTYQRCGGGRRVIRKRVGN